MIEVEWTRMRKVSKKGVRSPIRKCHEVTQRGENSEWALENYYKMAGEEGRRPGEQHGGQRCTLCRKSTISSTRLKRRHEMKQWETRPEWLGGARWRRVLSAELKECAVDPEMRHYQRVFHRRMSRMRASERILSKDARDDEWWIGNALDWERADRPGELQSLLWKDSLLVTRVVPWGTAISKEQAEEHRPHRRD